MAISNPIILAENIFELGATITATDTDSDTDYNVLHIKDRRTHTFWKGASSGTKYLTVDCGYAVTADALGIMSHNLYTCGATISVECSSDNFVGDVTEALAGFTVTTDRAILKTFTQQTKRYWRIKIVTASVAAYLAIAFLGDRVTFPRTYAKNSGFEPRPQEIVAESVRSKTGNILGSTVQYISRSIKLTVQYVTNAWLSATFEPLWDNYLSQLYPVFYAWEITEHPTEVDYVKLPDNFKRSFPYDATGNRTISLEFEGVKEA